jgi:hypothetical protein
LSPHLSNNDEVRYREVLAIAGAVKENKGLICLDLRFAPRMSDEIWDAVCVSLEAHPTLEVLDLRSRDDFIAPAALKSRIQALVNMLKVNISIHTIKIGDHNYQQKLFKESVIPHLETNRLRPRLLAIQKTLPQAYRAKVLGRALLAVRSDPNRFRMLLSGNSEIAFPSTTATTTAAASRPTPDNAAATVSSTVASSVVASAAGQKRKACP